MSSKTRIDKLKDIVKQKRRERDSEKSRQYLEFIYDFAEMVAKKGLSTFVISLEEIANQQLDKLSAEMFSKSLINMLQEEGFTCHIEWTHPDCYLYKYCEQFCKPERIKISFE
jgi:hypothetical protein